MKNTYTIIFLAILQFTNNGQAAEFTDSTTLAVDRGPNKILAVDLDRDGKDEIIVSSHVNGSISSLKFNKRGKISTKKTYSVGVNPSELVVFDMNSDSYNDLLIANHETNSFHILYNDRNGGFDAKSLTKYPVNTKPHIHTLGAGDFNGDKLPDVVVDSWEDSQLAIYLGTPNGNFALDPVIISVSEQPRTNLVTGNIDSDDLHDIVTPATRNGGVSIVLGEKLMDAQLIANAPKAFLVKLADVNNDGNSDIITIHRSANFNDSSGEGLSLLLGNGEGNFKLAKGFPMTISGAPSSVVSGDINADGYPEIISTNYRNNNIAVLFYDKKLAQYKHKFFSVGLRPESVAIGDTDGDGFNEIIVANRESNTISLLRFKPEHSKNDR